MNTYETILTKRAAGKKMLAVLLDPDKCTLLALTHLCSYLSEAQPDFVFVGGSVVSQSIDEFVLALKARIPRIPIVLFPGNSAQFSPFADTLLYLSLLSGRNAEYLIGQQVRSALRVRHSGIETIPMGYILVDGGRKSAVQTTSQTEPIARDQVDMVISTAVAGELLGFQLIYLEAGSGARLPITVEIIRAVRKEITLPLLVGGGICSVEQVQAAFAAGADVVVVGNHFEQAPKDISAFCACARQFNNSQKQTEL